MWRFMRIGNFRCFAAGRQILQASEGFSKVHMIKTFAREKLVKPVRDICEGLKRVGTIRSFGTGFGVCVGGLGFFWSQRGDVKMVDDITAMAPHNVGRVNLQAHTPIQPYDDDEAISMVVERFKSAKVDRTEFYGIPNRLEVGVGTDWQHQILKQQPTGYVYAVWGPEGAGKSNTSKRLADKRPGASVYIELSGESKDPIGNWFPIQICQSLGLPVQSRPKTGEVVAPPYHRVLPEAFRRIQAETGVRPLVVIDNFQHCLETGTTEFSTSTQVMLEFLHTMQQDKTADVLLVANTARILAPLRSLSGGTRILPRGLSWMACDVLGKGLAAYWGCSEEDAMLACAKIGGNFNEVEAVRNVVYEQADETAPESSNPPTRKATSKEMRGAVDLVLERQYTNVIQAITNASREKNMIDTMSRVLQDLATTAESLSLGDPPPGYDRQRCADAIHLLLDLNILRFKHDEARVVFYTPSIGNALARKERGYVEDFRTDSKTAAMIT